MSTQKKIQRDDKLEPVCKGCHYRRNIGNEQYYNGDSKRDSSCDYLIIEGQPRGCVPKGNKCGKFVSRKVLSKNRKALILK